MRVALVVVVLAVAPGAGGCGGRADEPAAPAAAEYPLVTATRPAYQPAITTPGGGSVRYAAVPAEPEAEPSPTCERVQATFHDGSRPVRRPIVVPPAPGLRARAVAPRRTRLEWWFDELPRDCRPSGVLFSVTTTGGTPTNLLVAVTAAKGSAIIEYPDFLPVPETALASAHTVTGRRSRTVRVAIDR
jgi:hypothetical protein